MLHIIALGGRSFMALDLAKALTSSQYYRPSFPAILKARYN
jgi:hypothetical protein